MEKSETTIQAYRKYLYMYGILPLLTVMSAFELLELYEECEKIMRTIKAQERRLHLKLFTIINEDNIKKVVFDYKKFGIKTDTQKLLKNNEYYVRIMMSDLLNNYNVYKHKN